MQQIKVLPVGKLEISNNNQTMTNINQVGQSDIF